MWKGERERGDEMHIGCLQTIFRARLRIETNSKDPNSLRICIDPWGEEMNNRTREWVRDKESITKEERGDKMLTSCLQNDL